MNDCVLRGSNAAIVCTQPAEPAVANALKRTVGLEIQKTPPLDLPGRRFYCKHRPETEYRADWERLDTDGQKNKKSMVDKKG